MCAVGVLFTKGKEWGPGLGVRGLGRHTPTTNNQQPTTNNQQPTTNQQHNTQQPSTNNAPRTTHTTHTTHTAHTTSHTPHTPQQQHNTTTTHNNDRAYGVGRSSIPVFVKKCRARDTRRFTKPEDGQLQGGCSVFRAV